MIRLQNWYGLRLALGVVLLVGSSLPSLASTVSGFVREADNGQPTIANARVTLFDGTLAWFKEVRTDLNGAYSFVQLPPGTYQLGCAVRRFEYVEQTVTVGGDGLTCDFALGPEVEPGRWDIIGTTAPEFLDATDIGLLLPDGKIFYCHDTTDPILFDPVTGTKSFPAASPSAQGCMNGSLLAGGQVIMVGGQDGSDPGSFVFAVPWVKTYTTGTDSWTLLPDLQHSAGRWYPGLGRLADGSFLAIGGGTCCAAARTETCERFDLATQSWSYTGSMVNPTEFPPCALLYTGEVLATWWPPQLYDSCPYRELCSRCDTTTYALRPSQPNRLR